jgi:hypothetical protein
MNADFQNRLVVKAPGQDRMEKAEVHFEAFLTVLPSKDAVRLRRF